MTEMADTIAEREALPGLSIREACEDDLAAIVALLAADVVGGHGDTTGAEARADYARAFARIAASPADTLYVAELDGEVIGTFQTTLITTLLGRKELIPVEKLDNVRKHQQDSLLLL